jgi:hypothetical protein
MTFDYDRDGDMDVVITTHDDSVMLYRNDLSGPNTHWLEVFLDTSGVPGLAPDGYGSRVIATTGSISQSVWVNGGATYLGRSQLVAHFGLGSATTVDQLEVEWADGTDTVLTNVAADQIITVSASAAGSAPGEASSGANPLDQMEAAYNDVSGLVDVTYAPSCSATGHTLYHGSLSNVASYQYDGAVCDVGITGSVSFDPGPGSSFFLIVGKNATVEGSYGLDWQDAERPEDTGTAGCDLPRDLTGTCGGP